MIASPGRNRRVLALVAALLIVAPMAGPTALASPRTSAAAAPTPPHVDRAAARPNEAERRGHVQVSGLPPSTDGDSTMTEPASGPDIGSVGVTGGPPVDTATTNTTTAPTLTKLPVKSGHANTPNPVVAAGPDHVAWSDDGLLTISNRTGGAVTTVSFADFFLLPDGFTNSEGQIYYDEVHGRWIAVEVSGDCIPDADANWGHGYLDIAVSDTANPNLGWSIYYYTYNDQIAWDPGYGSSSDQIVVTSRFHDMFDAGCASGGPDYWDVTGITWADLFGGSFDESYVLFSPNDEDQVMDLQPVVRNGGTSSTLEVIVDVALLNPAGAEQWLLRIDGSGPTADSSMSLLPVPLFGVPVFVPQGFTPPSGPNGAVAVDDRLVFSLTEPCTPTGDTQERNCVRVVDIDTSQPTLARNQDFYLGQNGRDTFSPGVAISGTGDLVVTYQRSTSAAGPTAYVVRQAPDDPLHTVSAQRTLVTPTAFYQNLQGAELVGLQPDPVVPDAVWVINQAGGTVDPEPYAYRLQVAQARTATGDTYNPIPPVRILDTRNGTGLSGGFAPSVPRTFNVAGANGIPANAVAITGNVTVPGQAVDLGYLSMAPFLATPSIKSPPATSTLNFPRNDTRANNVTLPLNEDGDLMAVVLAAGETHVILDVTGYFLADDSGATYQPITAVRKLDTRTGTGLSGRFQANTPRSFQVTGGAIPAEATAVTGNLTVVGQGKAGYVSLTPNQQTNPATSTINFPIGDTRANGVTVPLSSMGKLWAVYKASGGSTDLIFDATGYYVEGTAGLRFYPLIPGRIMDTRPGVALTQLPGQFTSSIPRTLVTGGHFGIPGDAKAVTGNLTVVGQTKAGYVSITKDQTASPAVSTLNFPLGDVRANGATVPLNAANDLAIVYKATTGAKTHLILDVTGYFR